MNRSLFWIPPDDTRYVYGVSLVRALEWTLLTRKTLDAMARASDAAEALEELAETSYATHMSPSQKAEDFEIILHRVLEDAYGLFRRLVRQKELERGLLWVHDLHNLKALLKASRARSEPVGLVPYGLIDVALMKAAVESGDFQPLPPQVGLLARQALSTYELTENPRLLEVLIDTAAVSSRVGAFAASATSVLAEYAVLLADATNARTVIRMSRMNADPALLSLAFIPGGSVAEEVLRASLGKGAGSLIEAYASTPYAKAVREGLAYLHERRSYAALDRELENVLIAKLRETKYVFFSPAPIIAFVLAREHEVNMVRLVMVAKINRIPSDLVVARLPMLYG